MDFRLVTGELKQHGYAKFSCEDLTDTETVARRLGDVLSLPGLPTVQKLTPHSESKKSLATYSGNFGMGDFPMHTDLAHWATPPRYLLLRCVEPGSSVFTTIHNIESLLNGETPDRLRRALFRPRKRTNNCLGLLPLYDGTLYRWDSLFLVPVSASASQIKERMLSQIAQRQPTKISLSKATDCLLVDNWRMLHGRSAVPASENNRIIDRIYLSRLKG
jgi:hypothetical protein